MLNRDALIILADELLAGSRHHASPDHALITLPGPTGPRGARVDGLEGFARTFLLAAFRIAGTPGVESDELSQWYAEGITAGVDPHNPHRWVRPSQASQARVEAASIALALDMTRENIWDALSSITQHHLIDYFAEVVSNDDFPDNNWLWFRIVTETFLKSVGGPWSMRDIRHDVSRNNLFRRQGGWLSDGNGRNYDHYAGWAMHLYPTLWSRMSGGRELMELADSDFYSHSQAALEEYLHDVIHLIGSDGASLMQGRSLIYRFATAAPLWAGAMAGISTIPLGLMRDGAYSVIDYFIKNKAISSDGTLSLGWFGRWPALAQNYSGPSSPYWAAKGLLGISLASSHPIWSAPSVPLPVDVEDFQRVIRAPGWLVSGTKSDGIIRVTNHGTDHTQVKAPTGDSPLYARLGYSTATFPPVNDISWSRPLDQSVTLEHSLGKRSHRSGMKCLDLRKSGNVLVGTSQGAHRWYDFAEEQDHFGAGWVGSQEEAGEVRISSIVRGAWEVRLVTIWNTNAKAVVCGGWPIATSRALCATSSNLSKVTGNDLVSSMYVPQQSLSIELGVESASDSTPLDATSYIPWARISLDHESSQTHRFVFALELADSTQLHQIDSLDIHIDESPHTQNVAITWPDGERTMTAIEGSTLQEAAVTKAIETVRLNVEHFGHEYPADATIAGVYPLRDPREDPSAPGTFISTNTGWTGSFWPGMIWLAYQLTSDESFKTFGTVFVADFDHRLRKRQDVDHHDIGFLYTLTAVNAFLETDNSTARDLGIAAADVLMERFHQGAGILQAWGDLSDPKERGRAIIDSLMNTPLLHWASAQTGDDSYKDAATTHALQLRDYFIRDDGTTYHTFHFDPDSGLPLFGSTAQGYADDSCWARGQAWGIYGFAINYRLTGDPTLLDAATTCADYFINHLPDDKVAYWDLVFTDGSEQPRDSSAAAIAVCGLLELSQLTQGDTSAQYRQAAHDILDSLICNYTADPVPGGALLEHAVYSIPHGVGIDEGCLWGDYFYLEALTRLADPAWQSPWTPKDVLDYNKNSNKRMGK